MKEIHQIYDKAFKRILTLSDKAVINLINGLFGTDYPTNSKITYKWTEHEDKDLKRTLSDSILTINDRDIYHIEAQITEDEEIVFRVFEYGFGHAYKNRTFDNGMETMVFPRPCIVYLDEGKQEKTPDEYPLILKFEDQGEFSYKVPVFKLQNISLQELNDKKLIALLPFLLLKLRKKIEKIRSKENMEELKNLVVNDIIGTIRRNEEVGNLSSIDSINLIDLTSKLYMQIYSTYKEMGEFTMRLFDQSMELAGDKYEKTIEELEEENTQFKTEIKNQKKEIAEMNTLIRDLQQQIKTLQKNNS